VIHQENGKISLKSLILLVTSIESTFFESVKYLWKVELYTRPVLFCSLEPWNRHLWLHTCSGSFPLWFRARFLCDFRLDFAQRSSYMVWMSIVMQLTEMIEKHCQLGEPEYSRSIPSVSRLPCRPSNRYTESDITSSSLSPSSLPSPSPSPSSESECSTKPHRDIFEPWWLSLPVVMAAVSYYTQTKSSSLVSEDKCLEIVIAGTWRTGLRFKYIFLVVLRLPLHLEVSYINPLRYRMYSLFWSHQTPPFKWVHLKDNVRHFSLQSLFLIPDREGAFIQGYLWFHRWSVAQVLSRNQGYIHKKVSLAHWRCVWLDTFWYLDNPSL
jgi:hypothetical protein